MSDRAPAAGTGRPRAFGAALRALLSHWRRRPGQLAALLAGLMLATALWSGVQALNAQARDSYARAAATLGGAETARLEPAAGGTVPQALFATLRRLGWPVSPVVEGRIHVGDRSVRVLGVEPLTLPPGGAVRAGLAEASDAEALLARPRRTLAAPETLAELGLAEGATPRTERGPVPALEAREGLAAATLVMDVGPAQRLLGLEGRVTRFLAPGDFAPSVEALRAAAGGALALRPGSAAEELARLTQSFHLNLTAFGVLAFVVALFIVRGAVGLAFEQRLGTVRTLRACGVSGRALAAALSAELAALALLAGATGVGLGWLLARALLPDVAMTLRGLYDAPVSGALRFDWGWMLAGLAAALVGAAVAAAGGLWRTLRAPALEAARPAAWAAGWARRMRAQTVAGLAALLTAWALAVWGESLTAGFALLAALLVGAALLLPAALSALLALLASRARRPLLAWALADARQALSGLSLALTALMLAAAANIGVGAMVGSFRDAFEGWLDRRLAAEIYVETDAPRQAEALSRLAASAPEIAALLPSLRAEIRLSGAPVELLGLTPHPTYSERWPLIDAAAEPWAAVAAGEGALVSEQLARRQGLAPGDRFAVPLGEGWPLRVVGVYPDYGNPKGQLVVDHDALAARAPQAARGSFAIRTAEGGREAALARLRAEPGLDGAEIADQASVKAFSLAVFDRTFAVTAALNALTFAVAGAALFAGLATLAETRAPQLAPVWAAGAPRRRLAALEFARTLALAAATAALAIPLGVALAWALTAVVNVRAFGWRLPLSHYPGDWAALTALAAATAAAAAALPARRLARTPPARLLAVFAQER